MNKRPLCTAALLWAVLLWLLGMAGVPFLSYASPELPCDIEEPVLVTGIIYKKNEYPQSTNLYLKQANLISHKKFISMDSIKITVSNKKLKQQAEVGNQAAVLGKLEQIPFPANPGQFHERAYYYARKVKWYQRAEKVTIVKQEGDRLLTLQNQVQKKLKQGIFAAFPQREAAILEAILLGDKGDMEQQEILLFQILNSSSLLVVSGLHLSVLGQGLFRVLRKVGIPVWGAALTAILLLLFYGGITGSGASVLRAEIMFAVSMGALLFGRTYDFLSAIALSSILLLADSPLYLYDSGFLLSFGAVLGLALVQPMLVSQNREGQKNHISCNASGEKDRGVIFRVFSYIGCRCFVKDLREQLESLNLYGRSAADFCGKSACTPRQREAGSAKSLRVQLEALNLCGKVLRSIRQGVWSSLSVWCMLLPILMYFFSEVVLWGSAASLLILPTAGFLLTFGALGAVFGLIPVPMLGTIAGFPCVVLLKLYLSIGEWVQSLPGAVWITGRPEIWRCVVYYAFLGAALWWKGRKSKDKGALLWPLPFCLALFVLLFSIKEQNIRVIYLDVGQGDCACIMVEGSCYLVDGGSSSVSKVGRYRILPFLKAEGIRQVDGVFVSHMDEDHVNGIQELLEMIKNRETSLRISKLFLSACRETQEKQEKLRTLAHEAGCEVIFIKARTQIKDKELKIQCLAPAKETLDSNAGSQVLHWQWRDLDLLFTGDVEGKGEQALKEILANRKKESFEVLKTAHHGSKNSTDEAFLELVNPKTAIISCGKDNSYGHPHAELLTRLEEAEAQIFNTVDCGAVFVSYHGKEMRISFQYSGSMLK